MKFPVLWLSFVSVWAGTEKVISLAWDLVSRSHITLHFGAKVAKTKAKTKQNINAKKINAPKSSMCQKQQELNYWFNNVKVKSGR